MKGSNTPPSERRPVTGLTTKPSLQLLHEVHQAAWIELPQFTETSHSTWQQTFWSVVVSVPGFPPGIGISAKRAAARRQAADRIMQHIRPTLNVCPWSGRDFYPTRKKAQDAVDQQQMLGVGKPLTDAFRCTMCEGWHTSGKRWTKLKKKLKKGQARSGLPWNAQPRTHEIMTTAHGERRAVVMATLGVNVPEECMGQSVAVIMDRTLLTELLEALDKEES